MADSATSSTLVYTRFFELCPLLDHHLAELQVKRGFTPDAIARLRYRSGGPHVKELLGKLKAEFSEDDLTAAQLLTIDTQETNPKLLNNTVLIPYLDWSTDGAPVSFMRPHKDQFKGAMLRPYLPGPIKNFAIIAESEFKAAAAHQMGFSAIGVQGISSFSGANYDALRRLLQEAKIASAIVIFDTEIKNDPKLPTYKPEPEKRWGTETYSYVMAKLLLKDGINCTIGRLPVEWCVDGKTDIDGALAAGKTRQDLVDVIKRQLDPEAYVKTLPSDGQTMVRRQWRRRNLNTRVREEFHKYVIDKKEGEVVVPQQVSNFVLRIDNNFIQADRTCQREAYLKNESEEEAGPLMLEGEHMANAGSFKSHCMSLGNFQWTGSQKDLDAVVAYEMAKDIGNKIHQPDHVGWLKDEGLYLFENVAVTALGEVTAATENGTMWQGQKGYQAIPLVNTSGGEAINIGIPRLATEEIDPLNLIEMMRSNFKGHQGVKLAAAWVIASLFSHDLCRIYYPLAFPILFIAGKTRSGKSTLCKWLTAMAGVHEDGYNYMNATLVGIERALGYYSSLPVWLDEYRNLKDDKQREREGLLRAIYGRQFALKGTRSNFGVRGALIRGTLLVSGEDTPQDPATLQRCVVVNIAREDRDPQNAVYNKLNNLTEAMSGVAITVIKRVRDRGHRVRDRIMELRDEFRGAGVDDRTSITYAIVSGAYDQLVCEGDREFMSYVKERAQNAFSQKASEEPTAQFIEALQLLRAQGELNGDMVRVYQGKIAIYFKGVFSLWAQHQVRVHHEIDFKEETILDHFKGEDYFIERGRGVRMGKQTVRCLILDPEKDERLMSLKDSLEREDEPKSGLWRKDTDS